MKNRRIFFLPLILFLGLSLFPVYAERRPGGNASGPAPSRSKKKKKTDERAEALKKIYPVLKTYYETMETLPRNLMDLYREAFVDDPMIFFVKKTPEYELAGQFPERATPSFDIISRKWEGNICSCGPFGDGEIFYLSADGTVRKDKVDLLKYYGKWNHALPPPSAKIKKKELERETARLGVLLREIRTDKGTAAVVVDRIIPGYRSQTGPVYGNRVLLAPCDRLIRVGGHRVRDLAGLEKAMKYLNIRSGYTITVLRNTLCWAKPLRPVMSLDRSGRRADDPKWIMKAAQVYLDDGGPGLIGINTKDHAAGQEVTGVRKGGAGHKAGLNKGDVIMSVEGNPVRSTAHLSDLVKTFPAGTTIKVALERNGRKQTVDVTLGKQNTLTLDNVRFNIRAGQLHFNKAMAYADKTVNVRGVVELVKAYRGEKAALKWITGAIRKPSPVHKSMLGQLYRARARLLEDMGRWEEAVKTYSQVHKIHGKSSTIYRETGDVYWRQKKYDKAIELYKESVNAADKWSLPGAKYSLARKLREAGRKTEAREIYRSLLNHKFYGKMAEKELKALK